MALPALTSYSVGAGQPIHGGRWPGGRLYSGVELDAVAPAGTLAAAQSDVTGNVTLDVVAPAGALSNGMPAWWNAATVGQWVAISGTTGPGAGLNTDAFSDMTLRPSDSTVIVAAAGGHADGASNAVASICLLDDAPAWTTRKASTWNGSESNVLYYADGRPASRHTYHHTHYIESLDAVLLAGCRFAWGASTPQGPGMDLFDLTTNDYLAAGTWPDIPAAGHYGVVQDGDGNIWTQTGRKFTVSTATWSVPGTGSLLRYPAAYDSVRNKIFAMQYDDGEGFATVGFQAKELDPTTGNSQTITVNSSAAKTAFDAAAPAYAGMQYCPLDEKFYFMTGASPQTLYVVTPNGGTTWDMDTLTVGGATVPSVSFSLCKRFLYVPELTGFVVQTAMTSNLHFLRMA